MPEFVNIELKPIKSLEKPGLIIDKLKELEALKSIGAVSEDEYNRMKTKILENLK